MHYQEIKDDFFENVLLNNLLLELPEIKKELNNYFDTFFAIGVFGHFVLENIDDEDLYNRCIDFINASLASGLHKTEDAFVLQVFSDIYEDPVLVSRFRRDLTGKAVDIFLRYQDL